MGDFPSPPGRTPDTNAKLNHCVCAIVRDVRATMTKPPVRASMWSHREQRNVYLCCDLASARGDSLYQVTIGVLGRYDFSVPCEPDVVQIHEAIHIVTATALALNAKIEIVRLDSEVKEVWMRTPIKGRPSNGVIHLWDWKMARKE